MLFILMSCSADNQILLFSFGEVLRSIRIQYFAGVQISFLGYWCFSDVLLVEIQTVF